MPQIDRNKEHKARTDGSHKWWVEEADEGLRGEGGRVRTECR